LREPVETAPFISFSVTRTYFVATICTTIDLTKWVKSKINVVGLVGQGTVMGGQLKAEGWL
jgi:hypothetical protein